MKVQIRSFVKGGNHGQFLQALGLAELTKELLPHAKVTHLDYEKHFAKELRVQTYGGMLPKFLMMRYYWNKYIEFGSLGEQVDLTIYGSDMIWHLDENAKLFSQDPILFGDSDNSGFKIAYAPSTGYRVENEPKWIGGYLEGFKGIGVRDKNTEGLVKDHSSVCPKFVIDPCFHLVKSKYSAWFSNQRREKFISVYSPLHHKFVTGFYENMDLNSLPSWVGDYKYLGYFPRKRFFIDLPKQFTDPLWTVQQIARSQLLITSTFHGVMMALMTKTPFLAVTSPNLSARLESPIAQTFSSKRLMSFDEFKSLGAAGLSSFLKDDDLDDLQLNEYIRDSEAWMRSMLYGNG